jgi:hypothetical protein
VSSDISTTTFGLLGGVCEFAGNAANRPTATNAVPAASDFFNAMSRFLS